MTTGMSARETLPRGRFLSVEQIVVEMDRDPLDFDIDPTQAGRMFERGYRAAADHMQRRGSEASEDRGVA